MAFSSVQFSRLVMSNSLQPHESQYARPPVHHHLPEFMSIESVMPCSHLILCHPLLLLPPILPSIRVFSNESTLRMRWPKYWRFSFSIIPSKVHPGPISSMEISRPEYWRGWPCLPLGDLPHPGIEPRSPALQVDSLLSEPPGKPKNTEVGSQSLLQGNFLTQESNQGLLHCRQILYQLSYQESPQKSTSN